MKKFYSTLIICILCLHSHIALDAYTRSPYVEETTWNDLSPYFLPEDHPVKEKLDNIFTTSRASYNTKSLKKAGFKNTKPTTNNHMVVAKHHKLKGYLVKLITDDQPITQEWMDWKRRVIGAKSIQECIDRHAGYEYMFKVPKKWIYPLPADPASPKNTEFRKHFVLVVEDMEILKSDDNVFWWGSIAMTEERMDAIYTIYEEEGLIDSVFPCNLPFCEDGKQAFVDTQHHHRWPIRFERLLKYFNTATEKYWIQLIENSGPQ